MISYITLFAEHTFEKITAADILSNIREGAYFMEYVRTTQMGTVSPNSPPKL